MPTMSDAISSLKSMLSDPSLLETNSYIGGVWKTAETRFDVTNPATDEVIAQVSDTPVSWVRDAIDLAQSAQKSWRPARPRTGP